MRPDAETLRLIVDAAGDEFLASGFAGTSIDTVARRAGVSSRTLYRLVPTKADLFAQVVSAHIDQFIVAVDEAMLETLTPEAALTHILTAYGKLTLGHRAISMLQLTIAERGRFPELATTFYEKAILATGHHLEHWLERQRDLGRIKVDNPALASGMLRGMVTMEPQRAVMLGQRDYPAPEEIQMRARVCARLFLTGCMKPAA